jgi:hypothetical protein
MGHDQGPGDLRDRNKGYYLIVDAIAWSNYRFLDYWRRVWEINSRSHAALTPEALLRDSVERANEILDLTLAELESQAAKSAELTERLASEAAHLQHAAFEAYRGLLATSIENLRLVEKSTTAQLEETNRRLAELQARPSS